MSDTLALGRINADKLPLELSWILYNSGNDSLFIDELIPDCACTSAEILPSARIAAGESAELLVTFEPYRPGPIAKTVLLKLSSGSEKWEKTLYITGYLEPPYTEPSVEFPVVNGIFASRNKKVNLGVVTNQGVVRKRFELYNRSKETVMFLDSINAPSYIEVVFDSSRVVGPQKVLLFTIYYHPEIKNEFGYTEDRFTLFTNNPQQPKIEITLSATIKQYISPEADLQAMPYMQLSCERCEMGYVSFKDEQLTTLLVSNTGKSPLILHKLIPNEGCEVVSVSSFLVLPGQTATVQIRVTDIGRNGNQTRELMIFSNDPAQDAKKITISLNSK